MRANFLWKLKLSRHGIRNKSNNQRQRFGMKAWRAWCGPQLGVRLRAQVITRGFKGLLRAYGFWG